MAAKKKKAYERIEKSLEGEDVSEIRGECQAQCDEALIKIYRKIVDDLDRKEELEKELTKLTDKISKLGEREETVAEDYLELGPFTKVIFCCIISTIFSK